LLFLCLLQEFSLKSSKVRLQQAFKPFFYTSTGTKRGLQADNQGINTGKIPADYVLNVSLNDAKNEITGTSEILHQ
jgi:hypothetical protein